MFLQEGEQATYGTVGAAQPSTTPAGVEDYYAVNAPAPGTVGVASARINHAYTGGGVEASSAGQDFSGIVVPGAVYISSTGQVPVGGLSPNPNYIPPPPQPAHSYTPTSRVAVPMSAQPLYSNTASQPIYSNTPRAQQARRDQSPPPPLPSQPPPPAAPTYANLSTNGAAYPPSHALYANVKPASGESTHALLHHTHTHTSPHTLHTLQTPSLSHSASNHHPTVSLYYSASHLYCPARPHPSCTTFPRSPPHHPLIVTLHHQLSPGYITVCTPLCFADIIAIYALRHSLVCNSVPFV
ncbi:hypothetical protein E2C01_075651 [Portunus trituberculatus]|uniref:Uncharacterized protein n=1 Tax=Portunus trituberculatus TaxID=210409 RepID=A0A5B7I6M5_PORTR|nr:hypothetical protein [Portunus trituberculatus]